MTKRKALWKRGLSFALSAVMAGSLLLQVLPPLPVKAAVDGNQIQNDSLTVKIGDLGQITSLTINQDLLNHHNEQVNFVLPNDTKPQNDTDHQWMGEMIFSTRTSEDGTFPEDNTGFVEVDTNNTLAAGGSTSATSINQDNQYIEKTVSEDGKTVTVNFIGEDLDSTLEGVMKGFDVETVYDMDTEDGSMIWSITIQNKSDQYIEFGDIGLPMPWNNKYLNIDDTYSNRLTVHSFAGADSGYMYAIRCSGEGNYMLFTPMPETGARIEYVDYWIGNSALGNDYRYDKTNWVGDGGGWYPGLSVCYIHSKDIWEKTGRSYLAEEPTSLVLAPAEEKTYSFKFSAVRAGDNSPIQANSDSLSVEERENNLRSILYDSGMIDAVAVPGFQTALNMETKLDLHYNEDLIRNVTVDIQCVHENDPYDEAHIPTQVEGGVSNDRGGMGEHGAAGYTESCQYVETKVVDGESHHIYDVQFGCIGNNSVCVSYELKVGDEWVTKYTQFEFNALAELDKLTETHSDFVVEKTQDTDPESPTYGIYSDWYIGAETSNDSHWGDDWSHDNIDFMVMKNYLDPDPAEIQSIETYLIDFMWENYMKYSHETFVVANYLSASGIYGTSERPYSRTFSEVMEALAFFNMYRIQKAYPDLITYRETPEYYLQKAYDIYTNRVGTGAIGFYGEQQISQMIEALWEEGMTEEAQALQEQFALEKGTNVANAAYPYGSEFEYDNTGEEGAYAAAKALMTYYPDSSAVADALEGMGQANMKTRAMRGMQPAWYFYSCPVFRGGEGWWNFQYTASLAGYIMDDWMRYESDGETDSTGWAARMNYAAKLSNFNAVNMGQISDKSIGSVAWRFNAYKGGYGTKNVNDGWGVDGIGTMRNGWNDFAGESDLGLYGSLLSISADVVTDPVFGLYGYGCNVEKSGNTYTVTPTDGFGKRINLLDEKLYVELIQDACTTAQLAADGSSITLHLTSTDQKAHTTQINLSGACLTDGYYTVSVNGEHAGQAQVSGEVCTVYAAIPAGTASTVVLTKASSGVNQAPTVTASCDGEDLQAVVPFTVRGSAEDDSLSAGRLTYTWSVAQKPEGAEVTISSPNRTYTDVKADMPGAYVLRLTVSDGALEGYADLTLNLGNAPDREAPVITELSGVQNPSNSSTAELYVAATADALYQGELTYAWTVVSQPEGGNAVIGNAQSQEAILLADVPGEYQVKITVRDAGVSTEEILTIAMDETADGIQRGKTVITQVGTAPVLPETMTVVADDGSVSAVAVTWDAVSSDQYASAGVFTVAGEAGEIPVACQVMVVKGEKQNLAVAATATAIIDTPQDLGGVAGLNDGYEPSSSSDSSHGVWHNWLGDQGGTAWVQYTWDEPVTIESTDAYYFKDGAGNFSPKTVYYEYLDATGSWKPLPNVEGQGTALNQYNTTTFDPVTTTALRMTLTPNTLGCGVIEWKVYGYGTFADRTELRVLLERANGLDPQYLTEESAAALATAIEAAQTVYDSADGETEQSVIDDAAAELAAVLGKLVPKDGDMAFVAAVESDYTASWEKLDGIQDPAFAPSSSNMGSGKGWGNWPQSAGSEHYVGYSWDVPVTLRHAEVYWYDDGGGTRIPGAFRLEYLDENGQWQEAALTTAYEDAVALDQYNRLDFTAFTTTHLRLYVTVHEEGAANGIYRFKVFGEAGEIPAPEIGNIASLATPTAIIDTPQDLGGVAGLNDGYEPTSSSDTTHGVWHNWLGGLEMQQSEAWVQYTWEEPMTIQSSDAYYFKDGGGNFAPGSVRYEYLDEDGNWQPVNNAEGLGIELDQYNTTTFDPVTTTAIRMYMTPNPLGSGVIEWKVYGKAAGGGETPEPEFVPAADITGVPTGAVAGFDLDLSNAKVEPDDATHQTIVWSVKDAGTTGAAIRDNVFSAAAAGEAVLTATIPDGLAEGEDFTKDFTIKVSAPEPVFVPVTGITGVPASAVAGEDLVLTGAVTPENATHQTIAWSIADAGTTGATLEGNVLHTAAAGTVTVTATVEKGASETLDYTQSFEITVTEAEAEVYTVTVVNSNHSQPGSGSYAPGETVTIKAGSRSSYRFVGWITDDVELENPGSSTATFEMPAHDVTVRAVWRYVPGTGGGEVKPPVADKPETPAQTEFQDVRPTDWYAEAVSYVAEKGIMTGVAEGEFAPDNAVTRAMVWTVLARMDGVNTEGGSPWYAKAQKWAMENGVSDGTDPMGSITREQLAAMLYRFEGSPKVSGSLSVYPDAASVSDWAKDAMIWATQTGLVNGINGSLSPKTGATRAQLATMLMRFIEA